MLPIATEVLELEITPEPARLPRRLRRRARAARRDRRAARAARRGARTRAAPGELAAATVTRRVPRPLPALHGARLRGRDDRALAAVAEGAPDGRRAAPDQQRRRHHQLRDAAHRPAAARLRPRPRRRRAADRARAPATASRWRRSTARRARSTREMVVIEDAEGPTSIAGVMGGARSEVEPDTTRVLMEVATWNGPNIHRTSWALGLRSEASGRFEKGLQPEQCLHAQAVATQLMLELCGARLLARHDRRRRRRAAAPQRSRLREARVRAILGVPRRARAPGRDPAGARLRHRRRPTTGSTSPCRRCAASDVTREIDLIEEVARIDGLERLPATLPARRGAAGRLTHAQRVRRGAEDALVGRGLHEIVGWSFTEPGAARPPAAARRASRCAAWSRSRTRCPRTSRSCARRCSARCSTPPATTSRAGPPTSRSSSPGPSTAARGERAARRRGADEHHALGVLLSGALHAALVARRARRRPTSSPPRRCSRRCSTRFRVELVRSQPARRWPFLHPGRSAAVLVPAARADALGFLGELHPLVAERWDLRAHRRVRDRPRQARRARRPRSSTFAPFGPFPRAAPGHRGHAARRRCAAARGARAPCAHAGGEMLERRARSSTSTRGEQVGEGRRSLALALTLPRRSSARSPTRTSRRCASGSSRRSASSEVSCVADARQPSRRAGAPRVIVAGATGFAGALAAHLLWRHPGFELVGGHGALGGWARRSTSSTRATACRSTIEELDLAALERARRRDRRLPARRRRADRRRAARARRARRRPQRRLPPALAGDLRALVRRAPAARAARATPSTGSPSCTARRSPARRSSPTPAATRPPRVLALAPLARAGLIADVVIDAKQGISGRRARVRRADAPVDGGREHPPLQGRRPPPHAGDRGAAGRARPGCRPARSSSRPPRAARPGRAGELLRDARRARWRAEELRELFADAYADEPFVEVVDDAARHARGARDQLLPHLRRRRRATPARCSCSPRSTTSGRAPPRRRSRTST